MPYFHTCSLYHYYWWHCAVNGSHKLETVWSVKLQLFDLPKRKSITLWAMANAEIWISHNTGLDICNSVWLVRFCNNKAKPMWMTEAAVFTATVWENNYVNVTDILFERALKMSDTYKDRCECHMVEKRVLISGRGTWVDDCRICLWCCLKTWPIPLTRVFDKDLDEGYWGHHRVMKTCLSINDSIIHVPVLFSSFSTGLTKCFIIF